MTPPTTERELRCPRKTAPPAPLATHLVRVTFVIVTLASSPMHTRFLSLSPSLSLSLFLCMCAGHETLCARCIRGARISNMRASLPIHTQPPRSDIACPPPSSSAARTAAPLMSERPSSRTPRAPSSTVKCLLVRHTRYLPGHCGAQPVYAHARCCTRTLLCSRPQTRTSRCWHSRSQHRPRSRRRSMSLLRNTRVNIHFALRDVARGRVPGGRAYRRRGRHRHSLRTRPEGISRCRLRSRLAPLPSNSSLARHTRPPAPWQVATAALCTLPATATEACLNARRVTQTTQLVQVYREGPHDCSAPLQPLTPCYDPAPSVSICQC